MQMKTNQKQVFVGSAHEAVFLVVYDESFGTPGGGGGGPVVLGSAIVPYWDERFVAGLPSTLFLEAAGGGEVPCRVTATLHHP